MGNWGSIAEPDRTFQDQIENEKVVKVDRMRTPTASCEGRFDHHGIKVTTESGNEYMVHKVGKVGTEESSTKVHKWSDMDSSKWSQIPTGSFSVEERNLKVGHFVEQSGTGYNAVFDNCQTAAHGMTEMAVKPTWLRQHERMEKKH